MRVTGVNEVITLVDFFRGFGYMPKAPISSIVNDIKKMPKHIYHYVIDFTLVDNKVYITMKNTNHESLYQIVLEDISHE